MDQNDFKYPENFLRPRNSTANKIAGTKTFRLASSALFKPKKPINGFDGYGSNIKNIEKSMRSIYLADKGMSLIQRDQSGAEALIVAYLTNDGNLRELFRQKIKPHTFIALHRFKNAWIDHFGSKDKIEQAVNTPVKELRALPFWSELDKLIRSSDDWPGNRRYYYIGKKIQHASSYGMGANRLMSVILEETSGAVRLSNVEARNSIELFFQLFPEIQLWHIRTQQQIKDHRILYNLFGYPHIITGNIGETMWKEAYAWVPQSSVGTLTNIAVTEMQYYIEDNHLNWHMLLDTYDSMLFEVPDAEIAEGIKVSERFMNKHFKSPYDGTEFQMKSEAVVGKNWGPYKQSNPEGLKEYVI